MPTVDRVQGEVPAGAEEMQLGPRERAVLAVLVESRGRVIDREQLRHGAGLDDLHPRRCDSVIVDLRRRLGPDALVTVRRRGWRLSPEAMAVALSLVASLG